MLVLHIILTFPAVVSGGRIHIVRRAPEKSTPHSDVVKTESLLLKHKELFDSLFPSPITLVAETVHSHDSYGTLVIASAGSGKTTKLMGKYAFLLKERLVAPREILLSLLLISP